VKSPDSRELGWMVRGWWGFYSSDGAGVANSGRSKAYRWAAPAILKNDPFLIENECSQSGPRMRRADQRPLRKIRITF
jgi:hypothetical protein